MTLRSRPTAAEPVDFLSPATLQSELFSELFGRSFSMLAFIVNRHLVDHFMRVSRELDLDYEAIVIWAVLAHQNCAHLVRPGAAPGNILNEKGLVQPSLILELRPLLLRDVSHITGIPRETVRRKLARLKQAGWIKQTDAGWLVVPGRTEELRGLTEESVRRFLATAGALVNTLQAALDKR